MPKPGDVAIIMVRDDRQTKLITLLPAHAHWIKSLPRQYYSHNGRLTYQHTRMYLSHVIRPQEVTWHNLIGHVRYEMVVHVIQLYNTLDIITSVLEVGVSSQYTH